MHRFSSLTALVQGSIPGLDTLSELSFLVLSLVQKINNFIKVQMSTLDSYPFIVSFTKVYSIDVFASFVEFSFVFSLKRCTIISGSKRVMF